MAEGNYRMLVGIAATIPPDAPKLEWLEPKLEGVRTGAVTPKTIRDDLYNSVLEVRSILLNCHEPFFV